MNPTLQDLRDKLDDINVRLIQLLAERFDVTRQVGELKRDQQLPPLDPQRESEQLAKIAETASAAGLDPNFAQRLMQFITAEVVKNHAALQSAGKETNV